MHFIPGRIVNFICLSIYILSSPREMYLYRAMCKLKVEWRKLLWFSFRAWYTQKSQFSVNSGSVLCAVVVVLYIPQNQVVCHRLPPGTTCIPLNLAVCFRYRASWTLDLWKKLIFRTDVARQNRHVGHIEDTNAWKFYGMSPNRALNPLCILISKLFK